MPDNAIVDRLAGIQRMLTGAHQAGSTMSSATKGREREILVDQFLAQVLPPSYRFGTGDAIDKTGYRTGQLDVVVEYTYAPSLPIPGEGSPRLYLAEGVAAVVEVKSNISSQWEEVLSTARSLAALSRDFGNRISYYEGPGFDPKRVPFFVVGYLGWKDLEPLRSHITQAPIDGILVVSPGLYLSSTAFAGLEAIGPAALWGLIDSLHRATRTLVSAYIDILDYLRKAT